MVLNLRRDPKGRDRPPLVATEGGHGPAERNSSKTRRLREIAGRQTLLKIYSWNRGPRIASRKKGDGFLMPNGLLQGNFGDILNTCRSGATLDQLAQAIERIVVLLSNPLTCNQQIQIVWNGAAGPAIDVTAASNATPQAIGIQIGQSGPQTILGIGNTSQNIVANCLNNRDISQTQNADTIARFTAAATKRPFSKTATGLAATGIATGKLSSDVGSMTAGPGELMPNAQVSGYQKVCTNNFIGEGVLTSNLAAATNGLTGAATASLQTWVVDPANAGQLKNGPVITITNRDTSFSLASGKYLQFKYMNGENRPDWAAC